MKPEKTDNLKKKDQHTTYTTKSTRETDHTHEVISPTRPLFINLFLLGEVGERNILLRVYLQMMYFLSVMGMGRLSGRGGGGGVHWVMDPLPLP